MITYRQDYTQKTSRQQEYAASLARDVRDGLRRRGACAYSASELAKYYSIDDLRDALRRIRAGEEVKFV